MGNWILYPVPNKNAEYAFYTFWNITIGVAFVLIVIIAFVFPNEPETCPSHS